MSGLVMYHLAISERFDSFGRVIVSIIIVLSSSESIHPSIHLARLIYASTRLSRCCCRIFHCYIHDGCVYSPLIRCREEKRKFVHGSGTRCLYGSSSLFGAPLKTPGVEKRTGVIGSAFNGHPTRRPFH